MKFSSQRDRWLTIMMTISMVALMFQGISLLFEDGISAAWAALLSSILIAIGALFASLFLVNDCELREQELFVRFGPFRKRIPYTSINHATPIRTWTANAAVAYNRVEIKYDKYEVTQISPKELQLFLQELKQRCPHAMIETKLEHEI